jgi:hypothetical protein
MALTQVGPFCRLLVTMHGFSGGGFLSYVEIDRFGVVMVEGGSYLVALVCVAGLDIASVKLRAVQVRHVFEQLHGQTIAEMNTQHQQEGADMLQSYSAHSGRRDRDDEAEPATAPPFAHFEQLYLRDVLADPPYSALTALCLLRQLLACVACIRVVRRAPSLARPVTPAGSTLISCPCDDPAGVQVKHGCDLCSGSSACSTSSFSMSRTIRSCSL